MNNLISSVIISTILALLLAGSGELFAQGHGQPPSVDQIFAKDDADGDGLVSKDEFGGPLDHFPLLDTNGDGYLTREEVTASLTHPPRPGGHGPHQGAPPHHPERPEHSFTQMDTNEDGVISADEFAGPPDHFPLIDANQDGALTRKELDDARSRIPPPRFGGPPHKVEEDTDR